jgi:hypothetical protein
MDISKYLVDIAEKGRKRALTQVEQENENKATITRMLSLVDEIRGASVKEPVALGPFDTTDENKLRQARLGLYDADAEAERLVNLYGRRGA